MALELKYTFKVTESGEIKIVNSKSFVAEMQKYFPNMAVIGTFRKPRKLRSSQQNRYYHGIIISEVLDGLVNMGFEPSELNHDVVHEMLRHKFLTRDLASPDFSGEYITVTKSTSELTTAEMMDYIVDIQRWAAEFLGIVILNPGEQKEIDY